MSDKSFTIYDEVIDDALSAFEIIYNTNGISKNNVYVLGHSFCGQLAPVIANMKEEIKGAVIMAGTTMHIIDLLMEQLKDRNDPLYNTYDEWDEYFRDLTAVVPGEEGHFFVGAYEKYWVSYNLLDIIEETVTCAENKDLLVMH